MLAKMRNAMNGENGEQGFTLIELIVVMAILAVLAGLVVPKYGDILSGSKTKAHEANLRLIEQAAELYYTQTSKTQVQSPIADDTHYLVNEGYLKEAPTNPLTNNKDYLVTIEAGGVIKLSTS